MQDIDGWVFEYGSKPRGTLDTSDISPSENPAVMTGKRMVNFQEGGASGAFEDFADKFGHMVPKLVADYMRVLPERSGVARYEAWMRAARSNDAVTDWKKWNRDVQAKLSATVQYLCVDILYSAFRKLAQGEDANSAVAEVRRLKEAIEEVVPGGRHLDEVAEFSDSLIEFVSSGSASVPRVSVAGTDTIDFEDIARSKFFVSTFKSLADMEAMNETFGDLEEPRVLAGGGRANGAAAMIIVVAAAMVFALA